MGNAATVTRLAGPMARTNWSTSLLASRGFALPRAPDAERRELASETSKTATSGSSFSFGRLSIQRKLVVGAVDDPLEHEADRVADQVMRMPDPGAAMTSTPPQISRKCEACEEEEKLQKKEAGRQAVSGEAPASVHETLRSSGQPLDAAARAYFEPRFGRDFSSVRVHSDAAAAQSARDVNAHAYTVGHNIAFNSGRFAPASQDGRRLIAHELTHVVQQAGGTSAELQRFEGGAEVDAEVESIAFNWTLPGENGTPEEQEALNQLGKPPQPLYRDVGASTDWGVAADRREKQMEGWSRRMALERPMMVLTPGGDPPDFVTVDRFASESESEKATVSYKQHYFHVLDAIEHDVKLATSPEEIYGLYFAYFSGLYSIPEVYKARDGKYYRLRLPHGVAIDHVLYDDSGDLDPSEVKRKEIFLVTLKKKEDFRKAQLARKKRAQEIQEILSEAEASALTDPKNDKKRERKEGPCNVVEHRKPTGGDPRHNAFAIHVAAEKGYGTVAGELTWTTPEGVSYRFDTYDPKKPTDVWEVKTQHEWASPLGMKAAPYWVREWEERIHKLDVQRLKGLYVANRCELRYRYAVDSCPFFQGLIQQWHMIPPVEYIAYEGEVRVPCAPGGDSI